MHEIGVRETVQFAGLTFNWETLVMTWISMAIVLLIAILATRNLKMVPTGAQNIVEGLIVWLREQTLTSLGPKGEFLCPLIVTLFLFLIVANWLGLVPTMASPTNDLNTTLGLALFIIVMVHTLGVYMKGMHYIKHFFQPFPIFVIINVIEEIAKPITLAFRLFGNILAGEILIIILLMLAKWAILPSVAWLAFSLFIGGVQAFIFTSLSLAYLANAVKDSEE
ncbi:MAG: F0F1 ATP synthase subunit A [Anaerovibrio sp.]|jgi:F-type H+-transporting ATPase subunit a|uniref:ATP synthase subunit a n=2 Tax=Anaerovibrio lipolyticus TaxID=82374 RepID=A0A0B2JXQ3_9FIRM|nr:MULTISPECIES: F0F1 ATP synthase subunit A [Anaerovibrio]KHM52369.1 ATP synthase F0 subunit A [Anaerovibrio lipolyticus]MBE6106196.1 F0F1 ATP synthase subunit A [Anaerovibrio lipolyticus]MBO5589068.1 F0F1 ATP synthase subunit A [Anaerovibrio sp.]MBO6247066.1 F0F1 ATP synthase subunit A [Anaerovibrio sp.]MBR2142434.1 F0F1 ATP synthase subunit A [Anaerovibrio sp.]